MNNIMIQGTASSVGKSVLAAALCRIFRNDGYSVAPFKSQNMSLNSFVTREGLEMGRAQVVQAEACGIEPLAAMNPILLKPTTDRQAQVILLGKVHRNLSAAEYQQFKPQLKELVLGEYRKLAAAHDIMVIEGAGSPAEINLKDDDIVNMGMAVMADAPVLLAADIDRGGVFASIVGTLALLDETERARVKGVIINKFRGDIDILKPGLRRLEELTGVPVLGVVPHFDIRLEDEDSVTESFSRQAVGQRELSVAVIKLPHISNFTDFNCLDLFDDVRLYYADTCDKLGNPDIVIIPGSKNTIHDLNFLKSSGLADRIRELHREGRVIIGICAGYQMLGRSIRDPHGSDGNTAEADGLGILALDTVMETDKTTTQVEAQVVRCDGLLDGLEGQNISGYEIHMGRSTCTTPLPQFIRTGTENCGITSGNVIGTYLHGLFDNIGFTRQLLNNIRGRKGLDNKQAPLSYRDFKEREYNRLAETVRSHLDMQAVYDIVLKR